MKLEKSTALIAEKMLIRREKVSVAESVTAGRMQMAFSHAENASEFFEGGITAYNLPQKVKQLEVDFNEAVSCNCVSEKVAVQMAERVSAVFDTEWGLGITGYAVKVPGINIEELFAFYAVIYKGQPLKCGRFVSAKKNMQDAQEDYARQLLEVFADLVATKDKA